MSEPYIGQIMMFAGTFAPMGYLACNGQTLPIAEYATLFNLIGTTYGGDGQTTFALPNLCGRASVCMGQGTGLSNYVLGQIGGVEQVTLTTSQLPSHSHPVATTAAAASTANPTNAIFADKAGTTTVNPYAAAGAALPLASNSVSSAGSSQPHENRQPFQAVTICISTFGIYPTQN